MKKIALSAFVIAASGAYVWSQAGTTNPLLAAGDTHVAPQEVPVVTPETANPAAPAPAPTPIITAQAPAEKQPQAPNSPQSEPSGTAVVTSAPAASAAPAKLVEASATAPATGGDPYHAAWASSHGSMSMLGMGFSDGTYLGPVVDAYYGVVQVQAIIKHGRLDMVDVLRWPADRDTSVTINENALPKLRQEAISAQSAEVDIISGATLLSNAFIQSLDVALKKARA